MEAPMSPLIAQLVQEAPVVTDGAWGTQLQARGLPAGGWGAGGGPFPPAPAAGGGGESLGVRVDRTQWKAARDRAGGRSGAAKCICRAGPSVGGCRRGRSRGRD